ncbi:hypothetical protein EDC32_101231 [Laceyella sacchari]|nr:hypothetical protein EDC32_101231 [Laceyella sacchari]
MDGEFDTFKSSYRYLEDETWQTGSHTLPATISFGRPHPFL